MRQLKKIAAIVALFAFIALITASAPLAQCGKPKASASTCSKTCSKTCTSKASACKPSACVGQKAEQCTQSAQDCAKMMKAHYDTHGWLGVELDFSDAGAGPVVVRVFPESPAATAGFRDGDQLTSLNGIGFTAEQKGTLDEFMANGFKVGETVKYTARRDSEIVKLQAQLEKIPGDLLDQIIANHLETAHTQDKAENAS